MKLVCGPFQEDIPMQCSLSSSRVKCCIYRSGVARSQQRYLERGRTAGGREGWYGVVLAAVRGRMVGGVSRVDCQRSEERERDFSRYQRDGEIRAGRQRCVLNSDRVRHVM